MRSIVFALPLVMVASSAAGQMSNTTCSNYIPNNVQCTTTTTPAPPTSGVDWNAWMQQQNQQDQQMQQSMENLGAAIAAERERKRQKKEEAAIQAAVANDPDVPQPPPTDEQPVRLVCTAGGHSASLALYEKHGRLDISVEGVSYTRQAVFTADAIVWHTPIARATLNRLDGSYASIATFPGVEGQTVASGSCTVAAERKF